MTTYASLRRSAAEKLTPTLTSAGFSLAKKRMDYWREKGEIYQVIVFDMNRAATCLAVYVNLWLPDGAPGYDMEKFPANIPMYALRGLTERGLEPGVPNAVWQVDNDLQARAAMARIATAISEVVLPWLDQNVTKAALMENLNPEFKGSQLYASWILGGTR